MNRINVFRTPIRRTATIFDSIAWGRSILETNSSTLIFAATLIFCSLAVGCSSEKPKPESSNPQAPSAQSTPLAAITLPSAPVTPATQAAAKPVHKKALRKAPATVTYADKASGVSFQYPRKYALKTGDAVHELVSSDMVSMDFVQPGGAAVAAVIVPEGIYPKSDLAAALFNFSVNKSLTAEQCGEFPNAQVTSPAPVDAAAGAATQPSKLMIGDTTMQSTEMVASKGTGKEVRKYYHVFENGECYEFALRVATTGDTDEGGKHIDRDEVFKRLEKILATVKINPVTVSEVTASAPAAAPPSPAQ
ncbi:MAG: hypothetical protein WB660_02350 [Candidatus Sulfotelmatobacter sp.]